MRLTHIGQIASVEERVQQESVFSPGPMTRNRRKSVSSAVKPTPAKDERTLRRSSPEPQESTLRPASPQPTEIVADAIPQPTFNECLSTQTMPSLRLIVGAILAVAIVIGLLIFGAAPAMPNSGTSIADPVRPNAAAAGAEPPSHHNSVSKLESQIRQLEVSNCACAVCALQIVRALFSLRGRHLFALPSSTACRKPETRRPRYILISHAASS